MKTVDVRVWKSYMHEKEIVCVVKKIIGSETKKANYQSGVLYLGVHRTKKSFLLSNGKLVYAKDLNEITI